mgnify:CR=1 FL=1
MMNEELGFASLYCSIYPFIIILNDNIKPKNEL